MRLWFWSGYAAKSSWNNSPLTASSLWFVPTPWQTYSVVVRVACRRLSHLPVCCRKILLLRSNRCVLSLPMWCWISSGKTRSYPPQSSVLNCLHSVFPSVLMTNCSIKASVCLPTQAARIKPLEQARLNPTQQSPMFSSRGVHCFCFCQRMTRQNREESFPPIIAATSHQHSLLRFRLLEAPGCGSVVLFD